MRCFAFATGEILRMSIMVWQSWGVGIRFQGTYGFYLLPLEGWSVAVACSSSQIPDQLHAHGNGSETLTFQNITCVHSFAFFAREWISKGQ